MFICGHACRSRQLAAWLAGWLAACLPKGDLPSTRPSRAGARRAGVGGDRAVSLFILPAGIRGLTCLPPAQWEQYKSSRQQEGSQPDSEERGNTWSQRAGE